MGTEEGTFCDDQWVLYGNQFDNKFHIKKSIYQMNTPHTHNKHQIFKNTSLLYVLIKLPFSIVPTVEGKTEVVPYSFKVQSLQSVKHPTSAQVAISRSVSSSPASGSGLTAQSLEPASDSVSPSRSDPPPFMLCLSLSQK